MAGRARGRTQSWHKWSFPLIPPGRGSGDRAGWRAVSKRRRISRFSLASGRIQGIYRCKGVIHSADAPGRRSVRHVVGKRVDLAADSEWGNQIPRTRIVAIGADGAVDGEALRDRFDLCVPANG